MRSTLLSVLLLIVLEGCCSAPLAEKYFTRSTPLSTVKMFQYAVETKQYDSAFACLNPAKIKEYSPTQFRWFVRLGRIEEWDGLRVRKLIADSERLGEQVLAGEANVVRVVLLYEENEDSESGNGAAEDVSANALYFTGGIVYHFSPGGRFRPYVTAGAGLVRIDVDGSATSRPAGVFGAGLLIGLSRSLLVRVDARDHLYTLDQGGGSNTRNDLSLTGGVSFRF